MVVERPITVDVLMSIGWGRDPVVRVTKGLGLHRLGSLCCEMASAASAEMLDAVLQVFQGA